jgi:hypothetical protein
MRFAKPVFALAFVLLVAALSSPAARAEVSFSFFYSNLSPYGSWHASGDYGRVWQPRVYAAGWNPYYDGHWVYTDLGWAWVSDYEWGALPYHYGTWVLDPEFGWVWVPGYVWAPSWVVFRTGPDYIGWAPVAPGFSLSISSGFVAPAPGSFVFVSAGNFLSPRVRGFVVPPSQARIFVNNTRIVNSLAIRNNVVVNRGPDLRLIERAGGRRVREVPIGKVSRAFGPGIDRARVQVDPERLRRGVRAAEPVSAKTSPPRERRQQVRSGSREPSHERSRLTPASAAGPPRAPRRLSAPRNSKPQESVPVRHAETYSGRDRGRPNAPLATAPMLQGPSAGPQPDRGGRPSPRPGKKRR